MFTSPIPDKKRFVHLQTQLKEQNRLYKDTLSQKTYKLAQIGVAFGRVFTSWKNAKSFLNMIQSKLRWRYVCFKYPITKEQEEQVSAPNYFSNEKFVVYTSIFGAYDLPQEPLFVPDNCQFFIVTDQPLPKDSVWQKVDTSFLGEEFAQMSNTHKNRFCKMFPHKLFPKTKYSIYIDGNIKPISDFTEFINIPSRYGLLCHAHKARTCVYDEMKACKILKKGNTAAMDDYAQTLCRAGFPTHYGMLECNMIVRDHTNPTMPQLMEAWWQEFIISKTNRDQLSLPYVLWKNHIPVAEIAKLGTNIGQNDTLRVVAHKG